MVHVRSFDLESGFSPSLFNIGHIERLYPEKNPDSIDDNLQEVDELDKRIEDFKKLYE
jgi:hypothetical protein